MRYGADKFIGLISRIVAAGSGVARSGSGALGLAYVAAGRRDGYVGEPHERMGLPGRDRAGP